MNGCDPYKTLITRAAFGEISDEHSEKLHAHLQKCESCRKDAASLKHALTLTSPKYVGEKDVPDAIWKRIDRKIESETTKLLYMWVSVGTAAAAIIISLLVSFAISNSGQVTPVNIAEEEGIPAAVADLDNETTTAPDTKPVDYAKEEKSSEKIPAGKDKAISPVKTPGITTQRPESPEKAVAQQTEKPEKVKPERKPEESQQPGKAVANAEKKPATENNKPDTVLPDAEKKATAPLAVVIDNGYLSLKHEKGNGGKKLSGATTLDQGSVLRSSSGKRAALLFNEKRASVVFNTNAEVKLDEVDEDGAIITLVEGEILVDIDEESDPLLVQAGGFSIVVSDASVIIEYKKRTKKFKVACLTNTVEVENNGKSQVLKEFQACNCLKNDLDKIVEFNGVREAKWAMKTYPRLKQKLAEAAKRVAKRRAPAEPEDKPEKPEKENPVPLPQGGEGQQGGGQQGGQQGGGQQGGGQQGGGQQGGGTPQTPPQEPPQQPGGGGGCPGGGNPGGGGGPRGGGAHGGSGCARGQ